MSNTTDEYWSINSNSLNQFGWNVATVGGGRYDLPPRRGEDIQLAYRPGRVHRPKLADSRTIALIMWVLGVDPSTGAATGDALARWNDSWDFLRRLVWRPNGDQVTLTRRWKLTPAGGGSPAILTASGLAEVTDTMSPTMTGRTRATFTMSLFMADPYFYGDLVTTNLALATPVTITNPGHDVAAFTHLQLDLIGPLTNPKVTNTAPAPDVWVKYAGTIASGQTLRLDVGQFTALQVSNSANLIAGVQHSGARHWMGLLPGDNALTLTADSGSGSAQLRYQPPYV